MELYFIIYLVGILTLPLSQGMRISTEKLLQNFGENLFKELNQFEVFPEKDRHDIHINHHPLSIKNSRHRRASSDSRILLQAALPTSENTLTEENVEPKLSLPLNSGPEGQPRLENNELDPNVHQDTVPVIKPDSVDDYAKDNNIQSNLQNSEKSGKDESDKKTVIVYNNIKESPNQNNLSNIQLQVLKDPPQNINILSEQQAPNSTSSKDAELQQIQQRNPLQKVFNLNPPQNMPVQNDFQPPQPTNNILDQKSIRQLKQNGVETASQQTAPIQNNAIVPQEKQINTNVINSINEPKDTLHVPSAQLGSVVVQQDAMNANSVTVNSADKNVINSDNMVKIPEKTMMKEESQNNNNNINNIFSEAQIPNLVTVSGVQDRIVEDNIKNTDSKPVISKQSSDESSLLGILGNLGESEKIKLDSLPHDSLAVDQQLTETDFPPAWKDNMIDKMPDQDDINNIQLVSYVLTRPTSHLSHRQQNRLDSDHRKTGLTDDSWYYNQDIEGNIGHGPSEKHAGKQMLMSAHHFDIPLGALAGAKMAGSNYWEKNPQRFFEKKRESIEPLSMVMFYRWIALATLAVLAVLTLFRHRHRVSGYVYDFHQRHRAGHFDEDRRLLKNAYA
ncbi:uncharacterized protein LOC115214323 isoform X1 [Argonauta hians]